MKFNNKSIYAVALTLLLSGSSFADCSYELFSISSTKDTKIIDFVEQLSDECEFSIIVTDSKVEEFLNSKLNKTHLKNLTIDEVLNIVLKENNLSYELENNLLKISYLTTKIFSIDYILSQRKGTGGTDVTLSSEQDQAEGAKGASSEAGINIVSSDEVKFWEELDLEFQKILNRPSDIYQAKAPIINKNAGLVTVTATNKQIKRLEDYLKRLQDKVQLQVLIDVQLLTVTMNEARSTGIDWKQLYALQNVELNFNNIEFQNVSEYEDGTITEAFYGVGKDVASLITLNVGGSLNEVIKFLETQGDVNAISNPKVLTLNNQPALISVGTEYFYKLQSNSQGSAEGAIATQQDEIKSVFAGVLLDITPEISNDNTITLKINPSLSETRLEMLSSSADRTMPPDLNRRQLSSVVTVKDGSKIILGGLINTKSTMESNKIPLLGDIPILSYLFKYEEKIKQVQELVIVIEPHIIKKDINNLSLRDLGYEGLTDGIVRIGNNSKKAKQNQQVAAEKNSNKEATEVKEADEI